MHSLGTAVTSGGPGLLRLEVSVRRITGVVLLLSSWACTERSARSAAVPERADFLPTTSSGDSSLQEGPRLLIRCEAGKLGAYVVVETAGEAGPDSGRVEEVPVSLDSTLAC